MGEVSQRPRGNSLFARFASGSEPFILTAMASLLGGTLWLFRERELLLGRFYRPEILSITHTLTLGWISMLMMGVLVRLSPRAMGISMRSRRWLLVQFLRDLYSRNLQTVSNGFLALGVAGAAAGIVANYLPLITFFHGLVIIGVLAFLANFFLMARWALLRKKYHPSPEDWERFYVNFHAHGRDAKAPG